MKTTGSILRFACFAVVISVMAACTTKAKKQSGFEHPMLQPIIQQELRQVMDKFEKIEKKASIGDKTETKMLPIAAGVEIINTVLGADINKPALIGAYQLSVDSLPDGRITRHYEAKGRKPSTRKLSITYDNNRFQALQIQVEKNNFIYKSSQTIDYAHLQGYQIKTIQKIWMGSTETFEVEAIFR